jgi:4-hydroxy-tetrahydrodipicolinate reductase
MTTKIMIAGAAGKMGQMVCRAVNADPDLTLVSAYDANDLACGLDVCEGAAPQKVMITSDRDAAFAAGPAVMIDFTHPAAVRRNVLAAIEAGVHCVVGTTGLTEKDLSEISGALQKKKVNVLVAPNFAIGAILMMEMAKLANRYLDAAEIIELHHDQKADAPSGTAVKTAEGLKGTAVAGRLKPGEKETLEGARGGVKNGIHIHSVRLPGLVAHQEVIFGGVGQTLTIRHDSIDRSSFMPGIMLAAKKIADHPGLTYGLEHFLDL